MRHNVQMRFALVDGLAGAAAGGLHLAAQGAAAVAQP